jgi:shikimate kinase
MPRVTLVGYRGTGKSTVAAVLADRLRVGWLDADAVLEERVGSPIGALIGSRGEAAFRDAEAAVLRDILPAFTGVLATGGGVVLRPENRRLLQECGRPVVWLTAPADVIRGRLAADPTTASRRPALAGGDPLDEVAGALSVREPLYREVADVAFDTASDEPAVVAERILTWLGSEAPEGAT